MKRLVCMLLIGLLLFTCLCCSVSCSEAGSETGENGSGSEQNGSDAENGESDENGTDTPVVKDGSSVGDRCYSLELAAYGERDTFRLEETRGKVTVLNFWATWCPPCVSELSNEFPKVTDAYGDKVAIVAVHVSSVTEDVQVYIDTNCAGFDMIFCQDESADPNEDGGRYYDLTGGDGYVPYTLVLDENGIIVEKISGATDFETLSAIIDTALAD